MWLTSGMCRPREATSVPISTASVPSWKSRSMRSRLRWGTSPEIASALMLVAAQQLLDLFRRAPRVDEHHAPARIHVLEQPDQQSRLFVVRRVVDHLTHGVDRHLVRLDAHQRRVVHVLVGELQHPLRQRRREQHVEAQVGRRQAPQDPADVADEAEVEHAIGLVEDQHLHCAQIEDALFREVDDAPWRTHQNVHALFELVALLVVVDAAEREPEPQAGVRAEHLGIAMDLHRQLARWSDDQRARRTEGARCRRLRTDQPRVHRHEKCRGFPCSGLRLSGDVQSGQCLRQRLRLNRRAALERGVGETFLQRFRQMQAREGQLC